MFHAYQKELSFFSGGPRARVNNVKIKDNICWVKKHWNCKEKICNSFIPSKKENTVSKLFTSLVNDSICGVKRLLWWRNFFKDQFMSS